MLLEQRIPPSYILGKVKYDISSVVVVAVLVHVVTGYFENYLPTMPPTIPGFIGTAISILLSFKIGQSYDRWWEARKVWGAIVNDSRNLVLQLRALVAEGNEEMVRKLGHRQIAWCYCLGQSLRGQSPTENLGHLLTDEDLYELTLHNNKPLALLGQHGRDLRHLRQNQQLELFAHLQLDSTLVRLCDSQGKAERIKTTILP